jgi:hypothetical protein
MMVNPFAFLRGAAAGSVSRISGGWCPFRPVVTVI